MVYLFEVHSLQSNPFAEYYLHFSVLPSLAWRGNDFTDDGGGDDFSVEDAFN